MRLPRRAIPVDVKCKVALRCLDEIWIDEALEPHRRKFGSFLDHLLGQIAFLFDCQISDLRLDHDPALALREKIYDGAGRIIGYRPHEHDVEFLRYRPHGTRFANSHDVKTRIRGDHGQFSDLALMKRERRRAKKKGKKVSFGRQAFAKATGKPWPKRKIRSASRWPPKESRKMERRPNG